MTQPITLAIEHGVARLTLSNPANRNAVDKPFVHAFIDAANACNDPSIRVILFTAEGPFFCVGADIDAMVKAEEGASAYVRYLADHFHIAVAALRAAPAPVILGLKGVAAGAGYSLVTGADLAIMARSAVLTPAYTASGLMPDGGGTWFTPRLTGRQRAFDILATNVKLSAEDALKAGLVARVAEDDALDATLQSVVDALLAQPEGTPAALKHLLTASETSTLKDQLVFEAEGISTRAGRADVQAKLQRFTKKS